MRNENNVHIVFNLVQDEDGWPPVGAERVWAKNLGNGHYQINNVPFYIRGVSSNDIVSVKEHEGVLFYDHTIEHSGHSTIRILIADGENMNENETDLRNYLVSMG